MTAKKSDHAESIIPNLIRVIKRSSTDEEYPAVTSNGNDINVSVL